MRSPDQAARGPFAHCFLGQGQVYASSDRLFVESVAQLLCLGLPLPKETTRYTPLLGGDSFCTAAQNVSVYSSASTRAAEVK